LSPRQNFKFCITPKLNVFSTGACDGQVFEDLPVEKTNQRIKQIDLHAVSAKQPEAAHGQLPARAAATTATAAFATTAVTAATAAILRIAPTASAATITTATAALRFRTSFVHVHRSTVKFRAVERGDCRIGLATIRHFNESESTRLTGIAVGDNVDVVDGSIRSESGPQIILRGLKIEIAYEYVGHSNGPVRNCSVDAGLRRKPNPKERPRGGQRTTGGKPEGNDD
jgi:hypothetical protein